MELKIKDLVEVNQNAVLDMGVQLGGITSRKEMNDMRLGICSATANFPEVKPLPSVFLS
ncbi:MAG: hypothetical protein ACE5PV_09430 [Candidatus Poribacteria bacterium]